MYRFSAPGPDATSEEQLWKLGFSMEALVKVMLYVRCELTYLKIPKDT
jgi:hypothetical protein